MFLAFLGMLLKNVDEEWSQGGVAVLEVMVLDCGWMKVVRLCEVADGGVVSYEEVQRMYRAIYLFRSGGILRKCGVVLRLDARSAQFSWSPMRRNGVRVVVFQADDSPIVGAAAD